MSNLDESAGLLFVALSILKRWHVERHDPASLRGRQPTAAIDCDALLASIEIDPAPDWPRVTKAVMTTPLPPGPIAGRCTGCKRSIAKLERTSPAGGPWCGHCRPWWHGQPAGAPFPVPPGYRIDHGEILPSQLPAVPPEPSPSLPMPIVGWTGNGIPFCTLCGHHVEAHGEDGCRRGFPRCPCGTSLAQLQNAESGRSLPGFAERDPAVPVHPDATYKR